MHIPTDANLENDMQKIQGTVATRQNEILKMSLSIPVSPSELSIVSASKRIYIQKCVAFRYFYKPTANGYLYLLKYYFLTY